MKKLLAIILALTFILSMFAMTACSEGDPKDTEAGDSKDTGTDKPADSDKETETDKKDDESESETEKKDESADVPSDEPNMFPYEHATDFVVGSIDYDWGAPDATSVYFEIDADHVIHDGKGTWSNAASCTPDYVFDGSFDTFYDCDEKCESVNDANMEVGVVLEDWNDDTTKTGYVGAWIEEGVVLTQIRFFTRSGWDARMIGNKFQASVDGVEWVDLYVVEELVNAGGDYEFIDIDDDTTYYYVRMLSRDLESFQATGGEGTDYYAYCNVAEIEIWGTPAAK